MRHRVCKAEADLPVAMREALIEGTVASAASVEMRRCQEGERWHQMPAVIHPALAAALTGRRRAAAPLGWCIGEGREEKDGHDVNGARHIHAPGHSGHGVDAATARATRMAVM